METETLPGVTQQDRGRADDNRSLTPHPGLPLWPSPLQAQSILGWIPLLHGTHGLPRAAPFVKGRLHPCQLLARIYLGGGSESLRAGYCLLQADPELGASRGLNWLKEAVLPRTRQALGEGAPGDQDTAVGAGMKGCQGQSSQGHPESWGTWGRSAAVTPTGSARTRWSHSSAVAQTGGSAEPGWR